MYIAAGIAHFAFTRRYEAIMPEYLPAHRELVLASGAAEIACGVGILMTATQSAAAWGTVALLIAVFPANLWMAQHPDRFAPVPVWALYARLPLQFLLMAWALRYRRQDAV
ncbi:DoxX family protein [Granulicella cerasi]|uniref:DoxX family protein n=2 Tax=Granulicella cerasi TaxID=741063 RepID=A0ABW1ZE72_9BACT|nr:DoxX family protein [Granulicella cerasi]